MVRNLPGVRTYMGVPNIMNKYNWNKGPMSPSNMYLSDGMCKFSVCEGYMCRSCYFSIFAPPNARRIGFLLFLNRAISMYLKIKKEPVLCYNIGKVELASQVQ